jgi:surface antigen
MQFSAFLLTTLLAFTASSVTAAPYPVKAASLNCRKSPSTSAAVVKTYRKGQDVKITCQITGPTVSGNNIWDKTSDSCYVADYYIKTGTNGFVTSKCHSSGGGSGGSTSGKVPGPRVDDYNYKGRCKSVDKWGYFTCQCTSFVAQRINERLGIKFTNYYKGPNWGDGNSWDEAARKTGVKIDSTPKPGAIAQTNAGKAGHVAWVSAVSGDKVTIEEYNYVHTHGYSVRTVPKSKFSYIHLR